MDEQQMNELLLSSGMPFLTAGNNMWIDAANNIKAFSTMDDQYILNCYNMSVRWDSENTVSEQLNDIAKYEHLSSSDKQTLHQYMLKLSEFKKVDLSEEVHRRRLI